MMARAFGECFREFRARLNIPLRQFCIENGYDAGNISKLERGRLAPPISEAKLRDYARALRIKEDSDEWTTFFDLAAVSRREIPGDIVADKDLMRRLPLVFRTLRGQKAEENLDALIEKIRKA